MTYLRLPPHVSYGMVGDQPIFLDVSRDRYLALDAAAEAAFREARKPHQASDKGDTATARLLATKLFATVDEWDPIDPAHVQIPSHQLAAGNLRRLRLLDVPEVWLLLRRARRALGSRALGVILDDLRSLRLRITAPADAAHTALLAAHFRTARALVPIAPSCLQDSIALGTWLARRGARPAIVFGVKLDPFAAHCWVQTDAAILNDAPDTVSPFTPVLVLS